MNSNDISTQPERTNWSAIWQLIKPYWVSDKKWQGYRLLIAVVGLSLGMVYITVLINSWNRELFDAIQARNPSNFYHLMWRFTYLAVIYIVCAIYQVYLQQALQMHWRFWITNHYLNKWLSHRAYYQIQQKHYADNPDQRIASDLNAVTQSTLELGLGLMSSIVSLLSFIGVLWIIGGALDFVFHHYTIHIPGYLDWASLLYAIVGSWLTWLIGRPLVAQNFTRERYEANFRFGLVRVREYAEAIALYRGENQEKISLQQHFMMIRDNWWQIMRTSKRMNTVTTFYAQFAIIFPLLVIAPRYFSGAITLGVLTQASGAFDRVQTAMSWFITKFDVLAELKASLNRLASFDRALTLADQIQTSGGTLTIEHSSDTHHIALSQLVLHTPDDQALTRAIDAQMAAGQNILVSGESGCGKSTLLRTLAGIWPYGSGVVQLPAVERLLFLPQKSYLPLGTLRAALLYPTVHGVSERHVLPCLQACGLSDLMPLLDTEDNWGQRLSPGEQQRLAFVRALLIKPDWIFLDEATSALDHASEQMLYQLLIDELPATTLVSVAHRDTITRFHSVHWHFSRNGRSSEPATVDIATIAPITPITH